MGRRSLALGVVLLAGLVAPGLLWAADEVPTATTDTTATTQTTTTADEPAPTATTTEATPAPEPPPPAKAASKPAPTAGSAATATEPIARAAASGGVTIEDFAFRPASMTVNVGDTVTWTNRDSAPHTATANDGSFDTGNLSKGESGSHTFNQAGTFSYICSLHPNMRGTITVAGGGGGGGGGSGSSAGSSSSGTASGTSSGSSLPSTGLQLGAVALLGLALLGGGALLRRVTRPED